ncbi:MAG: hypothetical protein V7K89_32850 [Nostoc sp.]|uniref:hypothetical protein n=1 Tax=Nostoc sp. TaxID=1180 RepID=UPI002FFD07E9
MNHNLLSSIQKATLVQLLNYRAIKQPNRIPYKFLVDGEAEKVSFTYAQLTKKLVQ